MGFTKERFLNLGKIQKWHFWFKPREEMVISLLRKHLISGNLSALDVGCGAGQITARLAKEGYRSTGIDIFVDGNKRETHPNTAGFVLGNATKLPFREGSFDLVVSLDMLEHVYDELALKEIAQVLPVDGIGVFSVPAFQWLWSYRDESAGHLRRYSKSDLIEKAEKAGFSVLDIRYYQFFLFPLIMITRMLGRKNKVWRDREEQNLGLLNLLLYYLNSLEVQLGKWIPFPWGSSLVITCRKLK